MESKITHVSCPALISGRRWKIASVARGEKGARGVEPPMSDCSGCDSQDKFTNFTRSLLGSFRSSIRGALCNSSMIINGLPSLVRALSFSRALWKNREGNGDRERN